MKNQIILIIFSFVCSALSGQDKVEAANDAQFIVLYTLGENWDTNKAPQEQTYFSEHSKHLAHLRKEGKILMGARYSTTGMLIFLAKNEEEANVLVRNDLAIENSLFEVEIHRFSPFYKGCVQ